MMVGEHIYFDSLFFVALMPSVQTDYTCTIDDCAAYATKQKAEMACANLGPHRCSGFLEQGCAGSIVGQETHPCKTGAVGLLEFSSIVMERSLRLILHVFLFCLSDINTIGQQQYFTTVTQTPAGEVGPHVAKSPLSAVSAVVSSMTCTDPQSFKCSWSAEVADTFISGCLWDKCRDYDNLQPAQLFCEVHRHICGGVTRSRRGTYQARAKGPKRRSHSSETSWVLHCPHGKAAGDGIAFGPLGVPLQLQLQAMKHHSGLCMFRIVPSVIESK